VRVHFDDELRANRRWLTGFLAVYALTATAVGYIVGLYLEFLFDPLSYEVRMLYGIELPWDLRQVDGAPAPLFFNSVFGVTVAFLAAALVYCRYLLRRGGTAVLHLVAARPLSDIQFENTVREIAVAAGAGAPRLCVIEGPDVNALACRDGQGHEVIAVTRGLLETMSRDELQAVVAHETAHLRNGDTQLMTLFLGMSRLMDVVRWVAVTGIQALIVLARSASTEDGDPETGEAPADADVSEEPGALHPTTEGEIVRSWRRQLVRASWVALVGLMLGVALFWTAVMAMVALPIWIVLTSAAWKTMWLLVILPLGLFMLRLGISRNREFQADAAAVKLTRNPDAVRRALERLVAEPPGGRLPASLEPMLISPLHAGRRHAWLPRFERSLYADGIALSPSARASVWQSVGEQPVGRRMLAWSTLFVVSATVGAALVAMRVVFGLFDTHPPLAERIERVSRMGGSATAA